jgi:hypothetical protein
MAEHIKDEELAVEHTEGFKVGEKKTIDEYQKLGKNHGIPHGSAFESE